MTWLGTKKNEMTTQGEVEEGSPREVINLRDGVTVMLDQTDLGWAWSVESNRYRRRVFEGTSVREGVCLGPCLDSVLNGIRTDKVCDGDAYELWLVWAAILWIS